MNKYPNLLSLILSLGLLAACAQQSGLNLKHEECDQIIADNKEFRGEPTQTLYYSFGNQSVYTYRWNSTYTLGVLYSTNQCDTEQFDL